MGLIPLPLVLQQVDLVQVAILAVINLNFISLYNKNISNNRLIPLPYLLV